MRHPLYSVMVALLLVSNTTAAAPTSSAYITNSGVTSISILEISNNGISALPVGALTHGVAVDPRGTRVYAASMNGNPGFLYAIDRATNAVVGSVALGRSPFGVAVSPEGRRIYVTHGGTGRTVSGAVAAVDVAASGALTIAANVTVGGAATGVAVSPNGGRLYVANVVGRISVVDTALIGSAASPVIATVVTGGGLVGIAVSPDGTRLYAADSRANKLWVVNTALLGTATDPIIGSVSVGIAPFGVAVSPDGRRVFVTNAGSDTVSVVDPSLLGTGTTPVVAAPPVGDGPHGIAVTSDGSRVYVVNRFSHSISVLGRSGELLGPPIRLADLSFPVGFGNFVAPITGISVAIDIKPGSDQNTINLGSRGVVPVAILSTSTFDAAVMVNPATVKVAGAPVQLKGNGEPLVVYDDVNGDGLVDLVVHVQTEAMQLSASDTKAVLEGKTWDDTSIYGEDSVTSIYGEDSVRIVPGK